MVQRVVQTLNFREWVSVNHSESLQSVGEKSNRLPSRLKKALSQLESQNKALQLMSTLQCTAIDIRKGRMEGMEKAKRRMGERKRRMEEANERDK